MYNNYFGFSQNPFSITPNPAFLYLSPSHQDALSHLLYGVGQGGGFVALTGEVGTGKTTLIRSLLEQQLDDIEVALCLNPQLTATEFVANICDELKVPYDDGNSLKQLIDNLNVYLLDAHAQGKRVVTIIDEAQQLSRDVLEEIRLLTNLETANEKLLRIILVGQPELQSLLARNDLRQLSQRITARSHIAPLNRRDTAAYIKHRIRVAGGHPDLFTAAALKRIYKLTHGVPRVINVLCERSLMGTYGREKRRANVAIVNQAAQESLGIRARNPWPLWLALGLTVSVAAAFAGWHFADRINFSNPLPSFNLSSSQQPQIAQQAPLKLERINRHAIARTLARQWQITSPAITRQQLCERLENPELECLSGQTTWRVIQLINRPVLMGINYGDQSAELLLLATDGQLATVVADQAVQTIPVNQLLGIWNGSYTTVIRNSSGSNLIEPGQRANSVNWLRQRISMADGLPVITGAKADFYDASLRLRVEDFQTRYGITPDGLVGGETIALLDNLAPEPGTPTLQREAR